MSTKFFDLLVFSQAAAQQALQLGFEKALVAGRDIDFVEQAADLKKRGNLPVIFKPSSLDDAATAVRTAGVRVLLDPITPAGLLVDAPTLTIAKDNGVAVAFSLSLLLNAGRGQRAALLHSSRKAARLCLKKRVPIILVSGARSEFGARAPRDLAAVGTLLGLTEAQALWALSEAPQAVLKGLE